MTDICDRCLGTGMLDVILRDMSGKQPDGCGIRHIVDCPNCYDGVKNDTPGRVYGGVTFLKESRWYGPLTPKALALKNGENHVSGL